MPDHLLADTHILVYNGMDEHCSCGAKPVHQSFLSHLVEAAYTLGQSEAIDHIDPENIPFHIRQQIMRELFA